MVAVQHLKGEIIQLKLSRKGGGMYLVSATPTKLLIEFFYNCVKFHKNSISSLEGVALTRYMPPLFLKV
jgi:hypothetical protein